MVEIKRAASKQMRSLKKQQERNSRPINVLQPRERSIHFDSPASAAAEEGVICLLFADPELALFTEELKKEDFTSEFLGRAFAYLKTRYTNRSQVTIALMSAEFTSEEMSHITLMIQKPASVSNGKAAMRDYIGVIKKERLLIDSKDDLQNLMELNQKYREKKGGG